MMVMVNNRKADRKKADSHTIKRIKFKVPSWCTRYWYLYSTAVKVRLTLTPTHD